MAGAPPPYYGPRKKSNTTTIVFIVLGVCAVCCIIGVVGLVGGGFFMVNKSKGFIACTIGFEETRRALWDYADDHKGYLPKAADWQDEIRPYFAKERAADEDNGVKMFGSFDPKGEWVCKDDSGNTSGIAFNSDLSGLKLDSIKNPDMTVVLFETPKTGNNQNMPYTELNDNTSPRILNQPRGWMKVFANGKVKANTKNSNVNIGD